MKHLLTFFAFLSISALQAQSNTFNLTDTIKTNSTYTYHYTSYICPSADVYNPCSNKFNSQRIDSIKHFLQLNPSICIEIGWHTDQRGSSEYNKVLSQKYATSLKQLIVDSTITEDRIIAIGYGESELLYNDAAIKSMQTNDEKETAYYRNRRVVIRIIKL